MPEAKTGEEKLLDEFIEQEREKSRAGSGDDIFFEEQIINYVNKQRAFWLDFIRFIQEKSLPAEKSILIEDVLRMIAESRISTDIGIIIDEIKFREKLKNDTSKIQEIFIEQITTITKKTCITKRNIPIFEYLGIEEV